MFRSHLSNQDRPSKRHSALRAGGGRESVGINAPLPDTLLALKT
jgi:hypothetical protein